MKSYWPTTFTCLVYSAIECFRGNADQVANRSLSHRHFLLAIVERRSEQYAKEAKTIYMTFSLVSLFSTTEMISVQCLPTSISASAAWSSTLIAVIKWLIAFGFFGPQRLSQPQLWASADWNGAKHLQPLWSPLFVNMVFWRRNEPRLICLLFANFLGALLVWHRR